MLSVALSSLYALVWVDKILQGGLLDCADYRGTILDSVLLGFVSTIFQLLHGLLPNHLCAILFGLFLVWCYSRPK